MTFFFMRLNGLFSKKSLLTFCRLDIKLISCEKVVEVHSKNMKEQKVFFMLKKSGINHWMLFALKSLKKATWIHVSLKVIKRPYSLFNDYSICVRNQVLWWKCGTRIYLSTLHYLKLIRFSSLLVSKEVMLIWQLILYGIDLIV